MTPWICSRRLVTVFSCSRPDTEMPRSSRAKPSGVDRAFRDSTLVLVADSTVDTSTIRLMRSLATTCSMVWYSSLVLSAQLTRIQRPASAGLSLERSTLGQSARCTDTP